MMDLDELERLLREATAGPWIGAGPSFGDPLPRYTTEIVTEEYDEHGESPTICRFDVFERDDENEANAALIAALRNCAEELIRDARRYREAEELGRYGNDEGTRDWVTAGTWLYPGDRIVVVRDAIEQERNP